MADIIEDSFIFLSIFKFFGLYQPQKTSFLYKLRSYIFCCIFTILTVILGFIKWIKTPEELALNYTRNYIFGCMSYTLKILIFILKQERIVNCLRTFTQDYFWPETKIQKKIVLNCVKHCRNISYLYVIGIAAAYVTCTIAPLFAKDPETPMLLWFPFDYTSNNFLFSLTYIFVAAGVWYNAVCGCMTDVLLGGLAYHGACQLRIMNLNFGDLAKKKKNTRERLTQCVARHKRILSFVSEYQECFSAIIFCQFAGSVGIIVIFIADLFFVSMETEESIVSISGSFVITFQLFLYCYYGQLLLEENSNLNQSIYQSLWYTYNLQTQKELIIVMENAQTPLIITVGKFVEVTLVTFFKMLRTMYSLVALLNKFQHN